MGCLASSPNCHASPIRVESAMPDVFRGLIYLRDEAFRIPLDSLAELIVSIPRGRHYPSTGIQVPVICNIGIALRRKTSAQHDLFQMLKVEVVDMLIVESLAD